MRNRVWIFQGNPDHFDIDAYVIQDAEITWSVNQRHLAPEMKPGDRVYLWRSGASDPKSAGIFAEAELTDVPRIQPNDPKAIHLWREEVPAGEELSVRMRVNRVANRRTIIKREWLKNDPVLFDLPIMKMASGTNFRVPESMETRLIGLWNRTGKDWTRQEQIAALWVYDRTFGKPLSKTKESLIALTAVRIGRAVSAIYNKVQNFISLDPRVDRAGFSNVNEGDRRIWDEFFDASNNTIRTAELSREFEDSWTSVVESEGLSGDDDSDADQPKRSKDVDSGQGYGRDAISNRAVELHAMKLAIEHYEMQNFKVTDSSKNCPYDLVCRRAEVTIRVEVKGTKSAGEKVFLTRNEVLHAQSGGVAVDLFIVAGVKIVPTENGPVALGGVVRVINGWRPRADDLEPYQYLYRVPQSS